MNGKLIVIEGLDGSGKSTQVELLKKKLIESGVILKQIKLPDYDNKSSTLVKMYLNGEFGHDPSDVNIYSASLFYAVDRYASFKNVWGEDYKNGTLILADRYTTSNAVHQTVKLPQEKWNEYLDWLFKTEYEMMGIPTPDLVIYLDMDVDISQRLMTKRYSGEEAKKDVHEANVEYLKKCRTAALYTADRFGWNVVKCFEGDTPLPIEVIGDEIFGIVKASLRR
ncbi:MAG: dTMP kinase [Candidatus Fimenecus sp.]